MIAPRKQDLGRKVEYAGVLRRAGAEGWLDQLLEAHAVECNVAVAVYLLQDLGLGGDVRLRWVRRAFRGRAGYRAQCRKPGTAGYRISLPSVLGAKACHLRVGLVLHEAAHIFDHRNRKRFGHGPEFCNALRRTLGVNWRKRMPTSSFKEIYDRHRGPYSLHLIREIDAKPGQKTDHIDGPFSAEEAHEESRLLVHDPKDNVVEVFVYSVTEGQFIGAFYKRSEQHRPWHEEEEHGRVELPHQPEPPALVFKETSVGTTSVEGDVRTPDGSPRPAASPKARTPRVPKVPRQPPSKLPGDRFPAVRGRGLQLGKAEGWPKSEPAQLVRQFYDAPGMQATAAEAVHALGSALKDLGVEHPASLVSRLKQAGLLQEVKA